MVNLSEIFRSIFGAPKDILGPDEVPRSIHEDFMQEFSHRFNPEEWKDHFSFHPQERSWFSHQEEQDPEVFIIIQRDDMFGEIEEMFNNFFQGFHQETFPPDSFPGPFLAPGPGTPTDDIAMPPDQEGRPVEFPQEDDSLRERMLKRPGEDRPHFHQYQFPGQENSQENFFLGFPLPHSWFGGLRKSPFGEMAQPEEKVDKDLDSEVERGAQSLDDILSRKGESRSPTNRSFGPFSSSSSSSFSNVTTIDSSGRTESRTTRRDASGNEEVTITRRIGDQEYSVKHRRDGSGSEESEKNLVNIDQDTLSKFNDKWSQPNSGVTSPSPPMLGDGRRPEGSPLSSLYDSIIKQFFPGRK